VAIAGTVEVVAIKAQIATLATMLRIPDLMFDPRFWCVISGRPAGRMKREKHDLVDRTYLRSCIHGRQIVSM
jgi:hypothetical protein